MDVLDRADLRFPESLPGFLRLFPDDAACAAYLLCHALKVSQIKRHAAERKGSAAQWRKISRTLDLPVDELIPE